MAKTTTEVSRLKLSHPDHNYEASPSDSDLHNAVRTGWTKLGDNLHSRFFTKDALANAASQDFDHNFNTPLADLKVILYKRNTSTGELTPLTEDSTPKRSQFSVVPKSGEEKTQITVTNSSGSSQDIALVIKHGQPTDSSTQLLWSAPDGSAPIEAEENGYRVWKFESGKSQKLVSYIKVPRSYEIGRQIRLQTMQYSPSSSNTQLLQSVTYLIRKNTDAVSSTANSHSSSNSALTNSVASQYREAELDLTDSAGKVNSQVVKPGDILKIELSRGTDTDTADVRFVLAGCELNFS